MRPRYLLLTVDMDLEDDDMAEWLQRFDLVGMALGYSEGVFTAREIREGEVVR